MSRPAPDRGTGATNTLARDTATVTIVTLVSRLTGFVRVLVVAAAVGNGVLGDTYHAANTVPNLLFELVAGGALQAVLVPRFVAARRDGGDAELGRVAGVLVTAITAVLAVVAVIGMASAPLVARLLGGSESVASIRDERIALATSMLLVFVPQVLCYGVGMVATAALAARRRFVAAAIAPACNNMVVIAISLWYRASRDGAPPSLDLSTSQFVVLVVGTTVAVASFTAAPTIAFWRSGVPWRPRWAPRDPAVEVLRSAFGWTGLSVVGTLLPTGAAIVLGSGAPGGVAVFTMAFAFFVLPHALVAIPFATATAPRVAEAWQEGRHEEVSALVRRVGLLVVPALVLAGAGLTALAWPIARVASFGAATSQGFAPIAHALAAFGPGLLGYGVAFVLARILFSIDDVRVTAMLIGGAAVVGVGAMVVVVAVVDDTDRAAALAAGYGITQTLVALVLTGRIRRCVGSPSWSGAGRAAGRSIAAGVVAGATMALVQASFGSGRGAAFAALTVAGSVGVGVFVVALRLLGGPTPAVFRSIGADVSGADGGRGGRGGHD